jgi:hypothetical protein
MTSARFSAAETENVPKPTTVATATEAFKIDLMIAFLPFLGSETAVGRSHDDDPKLRPSRFDGKSFSSRSAMRPPTALIISIANNSIVGGSADDPRDRRRLRTGR